MMGRIQLKATNISKTFNDVPVLAGIDMTVQKGKVLGIWGPNGCGKSTLVKTLAGALRPDSGTVETGKDVVLGYVPQDSVAGLYPWFTVQKNLFLARKGQKNGREVQPLLRAFGFEKRHLKLRPAELSGGFRERLALAFALARGSNCLLLDEPLSDQDLAASQAFILKLRKLATAEGVGIAVITHDPETAILVSDDLVVLGNRTDRGTVVLATVSVPLADRQPTALAEGEGRHLLTRLMELTYGSLL